MTASPRFALCIAFLLISMATPQAQYRLLQVGDFVDGELANGETQRFAINLLELTLLSFRVEAQSDALDPLLEIFDLNGTLVAANDDYSYPDSRDSIIQAFVAPVTGAYTIAVSAVGESNGSYRLHILPGYDVLALRDLEVEQTNWEVAHSDALVGLSEASHFALDIQGVGRSAILIGLHLPVERDIYFEAAFQSVQSSNEWQVGLAFRYLAPDRYHRVLLNKNGFWQVERVEAEDVMVLRKWTTHPAIAAGSRSFRLGVLVSGRHFDIVYNGQVVGSAASDAPAEPGGVGIAMRTDRVNGGAVSLSVAQTVVTLPTRVDGMVLLPQRLLARGYYAMTIDLARQQLAPVGGEIRLYLPESFVHRRNPGVSRLPVASNFVFEQFAIGGWLTSSGRENSNGGCGIYFHFNNEENYTLAYVTRSGDAGVSRRSAAGFDPGIYSQGPPPDGEAQYLLAIVTDEVIRLYADQEYIGSMDHQPRTGGIGIAAVNFEEVDTGCSFKDLWLLSFDD